MSSAEEEVYELRLQLAKTQVLLHEANAARHAAEQEFKRAQGVAPLAESRERECQSLRSMLRHALDENARLQTELAAASQRAEELTEQAEGWRVQAGASAQPWRSGPAAAAARSSWEPIATMAASLAAPSIKAALPDQQRTADQKAEGQQQGGLGTGQAAGVACPGDLLLLKAKLAQAAAALDVQSGKRNAAAGGQAFAAAWEGSSGAHTTMSVPGFKQPLDGFLAPAQQQQQHSQQGLGSLTVPPPPPLPQPLAAPPQPGEPGLQRVYAEIAALQQRLRAAEARFAATTGGSSCGPSRPVSPGGSRPSSREPRTADPKLDWHLIHQLRQRKAKAEGLQLAAARTALAEALQPQAGGSGREGWGPGQAEPPVPWDCPQQARSSHPLPATKQQQQQPGSSQKVALQRTLALSRHSGLGSHSAGRSSLRGSRAPASAEWVARNSPGKATHAKARRRSRSQQEEVSRLLMAGMSTSRRNSMAGGSSPAERGWVAPVVVRL